MQRLVALLLGLLVAGSAFGQNSSTTAGLAGVGAGAALGAASGQGGTTPSSATGGAGGGGSAPIEIQIMAFHGLQKIAADVAGITSRAIDLNHRCAASHQQDSTCAVLIEDPASANQIALYQALDGYSLHLQSLYDQLRTYFSLQVPPTMSVSVKSGAKAATLRIQLRNSVSDSTADSSHPNNPRQIKDDLKVSPPFALAGTSTCAEGLVLNFKDTCEIDVTFPAADTLPATYLASVSIKSGDPNSPDSDTTQTIQLTGTVLPLTEEESKQKAAQEKQSQQDKKALSDLRGMIKNRPELRDYLEKHNVPLELGEQNRVITNLAGPAQEAVSAISAVPNAAAGTSTGAGAAASTPIGLTYLSDIGTALTGLKSAITYSPSSFQPTTQAFELLIEGELKNTGIWPYTSTSALNVKPATDDLSKHFANMLVMGNDVANWTTQCKPPTPTAPGSAPGQPSTPQYPPSGSSQGSSESNTACDKASVVVNLAAAQQMLNAYSTLLAAPSDGSGNPVIVDVLRGKILSDKMAERIPSLQVSVVAAGGSTKTNSIFGVNLFYQFAPSYDAGVIATFELRDRDNDLIDSGARNVMFRYKWWKPGASFNPKQIKDTDDCINDSFCTEKVSPRIEH